MLIIIPSLIINIFVFIQFNTMKNKAENSISTINTNVFFNEFTFCKNDFKALNSKLQLEFADNVVWLDDLLFIYQIKERDNDNSSDDQKWYNNKVINKGVKQIKSTLSYLMSYPEIYIENEKGHKLNISQAKSCKSINKIIIYSPNNNFPEDLRFKRFYKSADVGLIHLFHIEDYEWVCKYLITPTEVNEYLEFREAYYLANPERSNLLPEQYILAHFFETLETDHFDPQYISNLQKVNQEIEEFDISNFVKNFTNGITLINHQTEYYPIIREISKLNRADLLEFKRRLVKAIEVCEDKEFTFPYRIHIPRTNCSFVFVPLHSSKAKYWKNALYNLVNAHKYDQKAEKCIGVTVFKDSTVPEYFQLYWMYLEGKWVYDAEMEEIFKQNPPPFRETHVKKIDNRYL